METSSFFYYTPDPSPDGQHGHFLPHPNGHSVTSEQLMATESSSLPYPSALVPPRPSSARLNMPQLKTSPLMLHAPIPLNGSLSPAMLKKNTGLLTPSSPTLNGLDGNEICFFPPTPKIENAVTPTVNAQWAFDGDCADTLTPLDLQIPGTPDHWRRTPPVTPVYTYPPSLLPSSNSCPSILLSACPSLSPSSEHSSSPELDFCDPRHLTYPTPSPLTPIDCDSENDLPLMSSLDDESPFLLNPKIEDKAGFSFFGAFDDFESDEDFSGLVMPRTIDTSYLINKQDETAFDDSELFDDDFDVFSDNDSQFEEEINAILNSEPQPVRRNPAAPKKQKSQKRRSAKRVKPEPSDSDVSLDNILLLAKQSGVPEEAIDMDYLTPISCRSEKSMTPYSSDCSDHGSGHAPIVRRGRKQSLTDDPSKTFVCTVCSRRFRRQEHLKRHFRSLHTQDKPFSCGECGKRFSRSDNLSQHARTHGSGSIVMEVLEESEIVEDDSLHGSEEDTVSKNLVFVNAAQRAKGDKSEKKSRRKRKRDE